MVLLIIVLSKVAIVHICTKNENHQNVEQWNFQTHFQGGINLAPKYKVRGFVSNMLPKERSSNK